MTIGLLPITGVPLPFVSDGGSNLLTSGFALGIILNISARKSNKTLFFEIQFGIMHIKEQIIFTL